MSQNANLREPQPGNHDVLVDLGLTPFPVNDYFPVSTGSISSH